MDLSYKIKNPFIHKYVFSNTSVIQYYKQKYRNRIRRIHCRQKTNRDRGFDKQTKDIAVLY